MGIDAVPSNSGAIAELREQYCREMNAQVVHYSWLERGFSRAFALRSDGEMVGYGLVGGVGTEPRSTITEFFIRPAHRDDASTLFRCLIDATGGASVLAQSNDALLARMLGALGANIEELAVLFEDGAMTDRSAPVSGMTFRRVNPGDRAGLFAHKSEPVGEWGIEIDGRVVATGGVLHHYNPPFSDLFMEVDERFRRRGIGGYLVQKLRQACRDMGRVPAARCRPTNAASRACLERAGMRPCARLLRGTVAR